jgi:DNA polymerase III delta prime subunit
LAIIEMANEYSRDLVPSLLSKNKPQCFSQFHFRENAPFLNVTRNLLRLDKMHILFVAPSNTCKTTFLETFLRDYFADADADADAKPKSGQLPNENIMYINSLKEQGISYYRNELKTFCQTFSTVRTRKKVVVIDDLDFVNDQCQQVFRNYIDRYGHKVHFIATCSSVQKVVDSMQSRLLFVHLPPLLPEHLGQTLQTIS